MERTTSLNELLLREDDPKRPSLENRVAFQWEQSVDTLGYRQSTLRDKTILLWLADALRKSPRPASVLDMGCAYGNHLLMLNAFIGHEQSVILHGVDLFESSIEYGRSFAQHVPGYDNCRFQVADITKTLPFADGTVDAVNLADVVEHLERPSDILAEVKRVMRPGGTIVVSTPLRSSTFKTLSAKLNRMTRGRLHQLYYAGKETELDETGQPIMETHAGHDHISEMEYGELLGVLDACKFHVVEVELMPIMSGSAWFDQHPFLLAGLLLLEGFHGMLRRPTWAHAVCIRATA